MKPDPRIERMAQVIHDAHVHIHPDAPQAIKDARGKPTRADIEAAMRIYESPEIRHELAETDLPDGSNWLAARDARVKAATTARIRATLRLLQDDGDITPTGVRILEAVCTDEERNHE